MDNHLSPQYLRIREIQRKSSMARRMIIDNLILEKQKIILGKYYSFKKHDNVFGKLPILIFTLTTFTFTTTV